MSPDKFFLFLKLALYGLDAYLSSYELLAFAYAVGPLLLPALSTQLTAEADE
jgi:hypothetical protein